MSNTHSSDEAASASLDSSPRPARRRPPWLLIAVALLHGLAFFFLLPPWMGEDEPWHVEYVHHIATGHMPWGGRDLWTESAGDFPPSQFQVLREIGGLEAREVHDTQVAILDSMREEHFWERVDWASWGGAAENFDQLSPYSTAAHQPPLYYVIVGQVVRLFGGSDVQGQMWVARGFSLLMYFAVVLAAYALASRVSDDPHIALLCAFFVAWWPMHARQAAVVNNDVLVKVFSAWTLILALDIAREGFCKRRVLCALGCAVAGLASKSTGAGVLVPLALACLARGIADGSLRNPKARLAVAVLVSGLIAAVPLAYVFSHNPAIPLTLDNLHKRLSASAQPAFRLEFLRTTVGSFNWYSRDLPDWMHDLVLGGLGLGAVGLAISLGRHRSDLRRGLVWLCLSAVVAQLSLVILRGAAAGRYALPALPAFAVLIAVGLLALVPRGWRARVTAGAAFALVLFDSYFLWVGLIWNQYGVWGS